MNLINEPNTYGDSPAAIRLVDELNKINSTNLVRKVGRFLSNLNETYSELNKMNTKVSCSVAKIVYTNFSSVMISSEHKIINTLICNLVHRRYKIWLNENNGLKSLSQRRKIAKQLEDQKFNEKF